MNPKRGIPTITLMEHPDIPEPILMFHDEFKSSHRHRLWKLYCASAELRERVKAIESDDLWEAITSAKMNMDVEAWHRRVSGREP